MDRLKLVLFLIILTVVAILLGQNRELLALKFFCPDINSASCLYRTPSLPLAVWMGIFAIAGVISSLVWQFLNQAATPTPKSTRSYSVDRRVDSSSSSRQVEYTPPETKSSFYATPNTTKAVSNKPLSDWEQPKSEDWDANPLYGATQDNVSVGKQNRVSPEPQDSIRTDSIYSYKFRDASEPKSEPKNEPLSDRKKSSVDDVYDATYRTVNNPQSTKPNGGEEDEEWI